MKRSLCGLVGLVGLVSLLATSGCGSSSSSGGTLADATASCNAWCDAYGAAACPTPLYVDAAECKSMECTSTGTETAACYAAVKTLYDCLKAQADICSDTGCASQAAAAINACQ